MKTEKREKTIQTANGELSIRLGGFLFVEEKFRKVLLLDNTGVLLNTTDTDGKPHTKIYYTFDELSQLIVLFYENLEDVKKTVEKTKNFWQKIKAFFVTIFKRS
jgi:hypothetical protein